jgi:ATP-binding cassette subfamily B protein
MKKIKLLMRFMRGSRHTYAIAVISVALIAVFGAIIPLIIKFTIDSVIDSKPHNLPVFAEAWLNKLGGIEYIRKNLWVILIALVTATVLEGIFMYLKHKLAAVSAQNSSKQTREKLYDHLQHLPFDYHVKAQTGDIIQRCTSDVETVQNFMTRHLVDALQIIVQVIVVLSIMISISFKYTLVSIVLIPIVFLITVRFFKNMMRVFLKADEAEGEMTATLQENLTGARVVKAFGAQEFEIRKFDQKNEKHRDLNMKITVLLADFFGGTDLICMLQHALVLIIGTIWATRGDISIGAIVAFSTYAGMLVWPLRGLGQIIGFMGQAFVSLDRIYEILDTEPEDYHTGVSDVPVKGEIVFNNVYFEYEKGKPVLNGISFKIEKGKTVAFLGATGSGKSSLVHLLLRLYEYQKGSITIDGAELSSISRQWIRKNIGIVLQEPFLFSKTIFENIKIANHTADDKAVISAARTACIDNAIKEFDKGYETLVGERGVTLSGGQRQRVAIARTIVRDVPILIFDDSLSAVDTETDAHIRRALKQRSKDTTTIIISHRITTLAEADLIMVLDKGRIAESGTHEELINTNGIYKRIWEIQSSLEEDLEKEAV